MEEQDDLGLFDGNWLSYDDEEPTESELAIDAIETLAFELEQDLDEIRPAIAKVTRLVKKVRKTEREDHEEEAQEAQEELDLMIDEIFDRFFENTNEFENLRVKIAKGEGLAEIKEYDAIGKKLSRALHLASEAVNAPLYEIP